MDRIPVAQMSNGQPFVPPMPPPPVNTPINEMANEISGELATVWMTVTSISTSVVVSVSTSVVISTSYVTALPSSMPSSGAILGGNENKTEPSLLYPLPTSSENPKPSLSLPLPTLNSSAILPIPSALPSDSPSANPGARHDSVVKLMGGMVGGIFVAAAILSVILYHARKKSQRVTEVEGANVAQKQQQPLMAEPVPYSNTYGSNNQK